MKNIVFFGILSFWILACERDVTLDETFTENKLVVQSFISPQDTVITVRVSGTNPAVGTVSSQNKWITNANVSISDGKTTLILPHEKFGYYKIKIGDFKIEPNKEYLLKVNTPDGRAAEASCVVPVTMLKPAMLLSTISAVNGQSNQVLVKWQDEVNKKNYYGAWFGFDKITTGCSTGKTSFISDLGNDGRTIAYSSYFQPACNAGEKKIKLFVAVYDEDFYEFFQTLNDQTETNGIPFTESIQVFTNIKGGYGIFSGYNIVSTTVAY